MIKRPPCEHEHDCECECGTAIRCTQQARFAVRRADTDPGFIPMDACEAHLADAVTTMANGDDKTPLIVTIYWDTPDPNVIFACPFCSLELTAAALIRPISLGGGGKVCPNCHATVYPSDGEQ